jgi:hypothetical protein
VIDNGDDLHIDPSAAGPSSTRTRALGSASDRS